MVTEFIFCKNFKERIRLTKAYEKKGYKVERPDDRNILVISGGRYRGGYDRGY